MKTPVKFELAKLLREKKFDEEVSKRWTIVENIDDDKSPFCQHDCGLFNWNNEKYPEYISAPTIAEVVMWLYEKHEIWVEVSCDTVLDEKDVDVDVFYFVIRKLKPVNILYSGDFVNLPTEAYEAAIEYTLKNLIL